LEGPAWAPGEDLWRIDHGGEGLQGVALPIAEFCDRFEVKVDAVSSSQGTSAGLCPRALTLIEIFSSAVVSPRHHDFRPPLCGSGHPLLCHTRLGGYPLDIRPPLLPLHAREP
jgi:hypothetical protein